MRLGRLVAAGVIAGAVVGFVGALLRPRTVHVYVQAGGGAGTAADAHEATVPGQVTREASSGADGTARDRLVTVPAGTPAVVSGAAD